MKKLIIYYFLFLFSLFSIFSAGVIDSTDGFQYLAVARNIYYTGKPTAPVYEYDTRKNIHMSVVTGKDGNTYSLTGLGYSLAYLPAVAMTDIVYKFYGISPPVHFPLENDWLIFLLAGFTNAFIGAILGVILLKYFFLLGLSKKMAILFSLLSILSTNLFVYTKHSTPHMMFVTLLMGSFLFIKLYSVKKQIIFLLISGLSYGLLMITYNLTYILVAPPLLFYYLLLLKPKLNLSSVKVLIKNLIIFFIGLLPFILINIWFENLRTVQAISNIPLAGANYLTYPIPIGVFFEGIYGQLLSPGRSIFIYSPLLLIIIFFWYKIKKNIYPELFTFIVYSIILITFYAKALTIGNSDQGIAAIWHGENSWGPRYLTPIVAFGMLLVGVIFTNLSKKSKYLIFLPLVLVGLYIEFLGILMPYQIKLHDLEKVFFLNGTEYKASTYSNLFPRYSPIIYMSKKLVKLSQNFPKTFNHGLYNVRFYDGIDFTFPVGLERWRVIEGQGYISFDDSKTERIEKLTFGMINHPISEASSSAQLNFILNGQPLIEKPASLSVRERNIFTIPVDPKLIKDKNNKLLINLSFEDQNIIKYNKQILGLIAFSINNTSVNLESIDFPYVSSLGPAITGAKYTAYGGEISDPWKYWDIHTQTYERVPDFWWIRNLYYWDIPKLSIILLLASMMLTFIYMGFKVWRLLIKDLA